MSKVKRFEYQQTCEYDNGIEEFVYAASYQIKNYIDDIGMIEPNNFDDLFIIMSEAHKIKKALKFLADDDFYDDSKISFEMYFTSVVKAKKLIRHIDNVVSNVLCDYYASVVMNGAYYGKWI